MRGAFLVLGVLFAYAAPAGAQTLRTAVVVVGNDVATAGALQQRLESALSGLPGLNVVPRDELAARLGARSPAPPPDDTLATLFAQAREAYFDDRIGEAMGRVESASRIVGAGLGRAGADRVTVLEWQTALHLAQDERERAEEAARAMLALSPERVPDLDVFRPSVGKLVEEIRAQLPPFVEVKVSGAPRGSRLEVDGRFVDASFRISPGPHKLLMRASGFLASTVVFDAAPGAIIRLTPALLIGSKAESAIEAATWVNGSHGAVADLGKVLGVDAVVAVSIRADGHVRAAVLDRGGAFERSPPVPNDGVSDLVRWLVASFGSKPATRALDLTGYGRLVTSVRNTSVRFASGSGFDTTVGGTGAGAVIAAAYGGSRAVVSLSGFSHERSDTNFQAADATYRVEGGTSLDARLLLSHAIDVRRIAVRPSAGIRFEKDTSGGPSSFAVFPAYSRTDALAGVSAEGRLGSVLLESGAFASQNLAWQSTNGWRRASIPVGFGWLARTEWQRNGWVAAAEYLGERRSARFSGSYPVTASVPLDDPKVFDTTHAVSLSIGYQLR